MIRASARWWAYAAGGGPDAYAHQELPFDLLVQHLNARDPSYSPLFQVKLVLQNLPHSPIEFACG